MACECVMLCINLDCLTSHALAVGHSFLNSFIDKTCQSVVQSLDANSSFLNVVCLT